MAEKIKLVQDVGINMEDKFGIRSPFILPTHIVHEIIRALEAWTPPDKPAVSSVDAVAVPGKL